MMRYLLIIALYRIVGIKGCKDTGVNCAQLSHRCFSPLWEEILTRYCPVTCGKCKGGEPMPICLDRAYNCPLLSHRCFDPVYSPIMTANCAATCGQCRRAEGAKCTDIAYNCPMLIHRCEDDQYAPKMRNYCRKTCGLCDDDSSVNTNEIYSRPEKALPLPLSTTSQPPEFTLFPYGSTTTRIRNDEIDKLMEGASGLVRLILGWRKRLEKLF